MSEQETGFVERDLRKSLDRYTHKARVRGDFMEAIFAMHSGLERIFDLAFDEEQWSAERAPAPGEKPSFVDKAEQVIPELSGRYDYARMNQDRNDCAHPKGRYYTNLADDEQVRKIAVEFVDLVLDAWPRFLPGTPPAVAHPPVAAAEDVMNATQVQGLRRQMADQEQRLADSARETAAAVEALRGKDQRIEALEQEATALRQRRRDESPVRRLPWRRLFFGVALLLPIPLLLGFGLHSLAAMPGAWAWPLAAGLISLVLGVLGFLNLWRFLRAVRLVPLVASAAIVLVVATLAVIPVTDQRLAWPDRAGAGLSAVLDACGDSVVVYTTTCLDLGGELAGYLGGFWSDGTATLPEPSAVPTPTATGQLRPAVTNTPPDQGTPAPEATSTE